MPDTLTRDRVGSRRADATEPASSGRGDRGGLDEDAWRGWLDAIVAIPNPCTANRAITEGHHILSGALAGVLGDDRGANFHTWAVWGSREAGTTIGKRDVPGLRVAVGVMAGVLAGSLGALAGGVAVAVTLGVAFAALATWLTHRALAKARSHVSRGNRIVLDEIGGVTARFVATIRPAPAADDDAFAAFCSTLAPGATADGGQDLLRAAFGAYYSARSEPDRARRHQLVFAANCLAVWHEHVRLQHDIAAAIPWMWRRLVTRRLLNFVVGAEQLHVARDLTPVEGQPWPSTLTELQDPLAREVVDMLRDPRRGPDELRGSGAKNWTSLSQRMNYVVDLFRSRHVAPWVFNPPYPDA